MGSLNSKKIQCKNNNGHFNFSLCRLYFFIGNDNYSSKVWYHQQKLNFCISSHSCFYFWTRTFIFISSIRKVSFRLLSTMSAQKRFLFKHILPFCLWFSDIFIFFKCACVKQIWKHWIAICYLRINFLVSYCFFLVFASIAKHLK